MLHWGLLLVAVAIIAGEDVKVGDKWATFIPNERRTASSIWSLTAEPGSTIKVFCPDARFPGGDSEEERCLWSKLIFDDGVDKRSWCGTQYDFQVIGKSSKLTVELILPEGSAGQLECLAKAVHPPKSYEEVQVAPGDGIKRFKFPEVKREDNDKAWRFKSTTDNKISLQCKVRAEREQGGVCIKDIITVDNGEGPKEQCGYDDLVAISSDKEITLRVETYPTTEAEVDCQVQAISGSSPNEFENIQVSPADDSSEIGVVPGEKGTTCDCGRTNQQSSRIINGTEVTHESKFPFMVSLRSLENDHFCGASIISPVHILTAAHCVSDTKTKSEPIPEDLMPTVGAHSAEDDSSHGETQYLGVKKVSIPGEWFKVNGSLAADIAILHLETPIKFSKWVGPVCLTSTEPPIVNTYIKAMGWGATEDGYPDILREANVQVVDKAVCHNNPREVCFRAGPSSSCFGDSGGPYVWADPETNRYTQVALVSYGYSACIGNTFVGTNTVHWYDWIQQTMAETSTEHGICRKLDLVSIRKL